MMFTMIAFLQLASLLMVLHVSSAATPAFITSSSPAKPTPHRTASSSLSSRLSSSTIDQPDTGKFNNLIYATDGTVDLLRGELKSRIIAAADEFTAMKAQGEAIARKAKDVDDGNASPGGSDRGFVVRLLHRIVRKISRSRSKAAGEGSNRFTYTTPSILSSESFRQMKLEVGAAGDRVVEIAEQLSLLNPTEMPTLGFRGYGGAPASHSKLAGSWKLRFTTAADATFPESEKRGVATTSQVIDAEEGTFTNIVDFEKGKLSGFRVVVEGEPTSGTDIGLTFRSVKILRKSRFPSLFGEFTVRLPSRLIRWLASRNKVEEEKNLGPYLRLRYLDDDLRMHTTDSGNWFIQTRL